MSILAKVLGAFGPGHVLEHEGASFTFGAIDKKTQGRLEVAYYKRARDGVYALKPDVSEEEYGRLLGQVADNWTRGKYSIPFGEAWSYYVGAGLADLVETLTGQKRDACQTLCRERAVEVMHVVTCVGCASFPDFFRLLLAQERKGEPHVKMLAELFAASLPETTSTPSSSTTPPA